MPGGSLRENVRDVMLLLARAVGGDRTTSIPRTWLTVDDMATTHRYFEEQGHASGICEVMHEMYEHQITRIHGYSDLLKRFVSSTSGDGLTILQVPRRQPPLTVAQPVFCLKPSSNCPDSLRTAILARDGTQMGLVQ